MSERKEGSRGLRRALGRIAGRSEQVGMFVGAATVPRSFQRTLMKRSTGDQAVITGASMAINYGLATLIHDSIEGFTEWRTSGGEMDDRAWRGRTARADAGAMLLGFALQSSFKQQPGEHLTRGGVRTLGYLLSTVGFAGLTTATIQQGMQTLDERTDSRWFRAVPWGIVTGAAFSWIQQRRFRRPWEEEDRALMEVQGEISPARALATSALVGAGLVGISAGERGLAAATASGLSRVFPGRERGW